ncbi:hypothetical protein TUBRATIS_30900 [Tubulinosema ratisbonensis]|uniref:Uncharacterized protein n=1 Tax=Tubulinosema ratisbonensis TaxID=291195 RepID=A0A437AH63_9MICR|nr:hypothetical protein TUBRATIS_30900 [Tubulinosema ratisbonensis]
MYLKITLIASISILIISYIYYLKKRKRNIDNNNAFIFPLKFVDGVPITQNIFDLYLKNTISLVKKCLAYSKKECDLLNDPSFIKEILDNTSYTPLQTESGPSILLKSLCYTLCKKEGLEFNSPLTKVSHIASQLFLTEKSNQMYATPFTQIFFKTNITTELKDKNILMANFIIIFKNPIFLKDVNFLDEKNTVFLNYFLCSVFVYKPNKVYDWLYFKEKWFSSDNVCRELKEYEDCFIGFCVFGRG